MKKNIFKILRDIDKIRETQYLVELREIVGVILDDDKIIFLCEGVYLSSLFQRRCFSRWIVAVWYCIHHLRSLTPDIEITSNE